MKRVLEHTCDSCPCLHFGEGYYEGIPLPYCYLFPEKMMVEKPGEHFCHQHPELKSDGLIKPSQERCGVITDTGTLGAWGGAGPDC